jgi:DNA-binding phage protein
MKKQSAPKASRKTLMLTEEAHARINRLATKFNVSQPDVIDAMLSMVDETRLMASIAEQAKQRRLSKAEQNEKRRLLEDATSSLSAGQLEALLKQLQAQTGA